jgi:hypothetical protein
VRYPLTPRQGRRQLPAPATFELRWSDLRIRQDPPQLWGHGVDRALALQGGVARRTQAFGGGVGVVVAWVVAFSIGSAASLVMFLRERRLALPLVMFLGDGGLAVSAAFGVSFAVLPSICGVPGALSTAWRPSGFIRCAAVGVEPRDTAAPGVSVF